MAKSEAVWIVEFNHSFGWTPLEIHGPARLGVKLRISRWKKKAPKFEYRARRYVPSATTKGRKA